MKFRFSHSGLFVTSKGYFLVKYNQVTKKFDCKSLIGDEIVSYLYSDIFTEEYDEVTLRDILMPILYNNHLSVIFKNLDFNLFCSSFENHLNINNDNDNFIQYLELLKNIQISDAETTISPFEIVGQSMMITDDNMAKQYNCMINSRFTVPDLNLFSYLNLPVKFSNLTINYSKKNEFNELFNGNTHICLFDLLYTIISSSFSFVDTNTYENLVLSIDNTAFKKNSYSHLKFNYLRHDLNIKKIKHHINKISLRIEDLLEEFNNYPEESEELKNELLSQITNALKKP